ncbi:class IV adenylate cyclase [Candidatus Woesearchaeota archaeon]|nr:class IV adenylate cyclase [Candidatus Woesearchaeota archaeon]
MREVEVKILEINVPEIKKKLKVLGAKKVFEGKVEYKLFDFPNRSLNKKDELLRIRQKGNVVEVVHKGSNEQVDRFRVRKETETTLGNFESGCDIFEKIGMKVIFHEKRSRESYKLGSVTFEIDQYPNIPSYLEIEAEKESDVKKAVEALGFTMDQTTSMDGGAVLDYYKKRKNSENNSHSKLKKRKQHTLLG